MIKIISIRVLNEILVGNGIKVVDFWCWAPWILSNLESEFGRLCTIPVASITHSALPSVACNPNVKVRQTRKLARADPGKWRKTFRNSPKLRCDPINKSWSFRQKSHQFFSASNLIFHSFSVKLDFKHQNTKIYY